MKCILLSIFVVVAIQFFPSCEARLKPCLKQDTCESNECCTKLPGMFINVCKERPTEGNACSLLSKSIGKIYIGFCPCAEGLRCEKGESLIEKVKGKCVKDSEVVETEEPDTEDIE